MTISSRDSHIFPGTQYISGTNKKNENSFEVFFARLLSGNRASNKEGERVTVHFTDQTAALRAARNVHDICCDRLAEYVRRHSFQPLLPTPSSQLPVNESPSREIGRKWRCANIQVWTGGPEQGHRSSETAVSLWVESTRIGFDHYESDEDADKAALLLARSVWLMLRHLANGTIREFPLPTPPPKMEARQTKDEKAVLNLLAPECSDYVSVPEPEKDPEWDRLIYTGLGLQPPEPKIKTYIVDQVPKGVRYDSEVVDPFDKSKIRELPPQQGTLTTPPLPIPTPEALEEMHRYVPGKQDAETAINVVLSVAVETKDAFQQTLRKIHAELIAERNRLIEVRKALLTERDTWEQKRNEAQLNMNRIDIALEFPLNNVETKIHFLEGTLLR